MTANIALAGPESPTRPRFPWRAVALTAGAAAFAAGDLGRRIVLPDDQVTGIPDMVHRVEAHSGLWLALGLAVVIGSLAMMPGILAILRRPGSVEEHRRPSDHGTMIAGPGAEGIVDVAAAPRGRRTVLIGGCLLFVGLVASVAHALAFYGMAAIDGTSGAPMDAVSAMEDASNSYPLFFLVIIAFIVGLTLGPILLAWGLRRAGTVPIWVPVAAVVFAVAGTVSGVAAGVVGLVAAVVSFGMIARSGRVA